MTSQIIGISRAEIHLWLASDRLDLASGAVSRSLMAPDEKRQEQRFHFQADRDRYLATRALVRRVLSKYEPLHPADWVFSRNAYGRPEIDVGRVGIRDLSFNISHTTGLIILAVTKGRAVGVDVESIRREKDLLDVAKQILSPAELQELIKVPAEYQVDQFLRNWTLKEAYVKARGMGVSIPLQKVGFRLDRSGGIDLEIAPELADDPNHWQCWQIRPANGYVLALCAERIEDLTTAIIARRIDSFDVDETVPLRIDFASV